MEIVEAVIIEALDIPALKLEAQRRQTDLPDEELSLHIRQLQLLRSDHLSDYFTEAFQRWSQAQSFNHADRLTSQFLAPFIAVTTPDQIVQIVFACQNNSQLYNHFSTMRLLKDELFNRSEEYQQETKEAWIQLYKRFHDFIPPDRLTKQLGLVPDAERLLTLIEQRYPDAKSLAISLISQEYARMINEWSAEEADLGGP